MRMLLWCESDRGLSYLISTLPKLVTGLMTTDLAIIITEFRSLEMVVNCYIYSNKHPRGAAIHIMGKYTK